MLIQQKIGSLGDFDLHNRHIDWLELQWYETSKRILRKKTKAGKDVSLKFVNENPNLTQGDILFSDEQTVIAVEVLPCDCIVIHPNNMLEMASICYEIGNKHLPLYFENNVLLVPFEQPLFRLLQAQSYDVKQEKRKLLQPLRTTVAPHAHEQSNTLFSRIMRMTNNE